jgi:hypothetical protein
VKKSTMKPELETIADRALEWAALSNAGLRLRLGELTAEEIRTVRAVLKAIVGKD